MDAIVLALLTWCQDANVPASALDEIRRRGTMVERIEGIQQADDPLLAPADAMAPPPDDAHKWYLTLVVTRGCRWCDQQRLDFERDEQLRAWAKPDKPKESWAHFQIVQIEDKTQEWRWREYRPRQFPALILQPPINKSWGDPKTIVYVQEGYLPPRELDQKLRAAIIAYAKKTWPQHVAWRAQNESLRIASGHEQGGPQPPFPVPQPLAPPQPLILPPLPTASPPTAPPEETPKTNEKTKEKAPADWLAEGLAGLIRRAIPSGQTAVLLLLLAANGVILWRDYARRNNLPLLIDSPMVDALAQAIVQKLRGQSDPPSEPPGKG